MNFLEHDHGEVDRQILPRFRAVAKSYALLFDAQRDHIQHLLGGSQRYSSGIFREGLLRSFFSTVLPKSVSVGTGFIYGFEQIDNSKQIDILIWDSTHYAAVYETREFVIIPPEAVIAAISVKSKLHQKDITDALENLMSIVPLDMHYRHNRFVNTTLTEYLPITKLVLAFSGPRNSERILQTIGSFFEEKFAENRELSRLTQELFSSFDPIHPARSTVNDIRRIFPRMIASIEDSGVSYVQGWGPPEDLRGSSTFGPGLRRLPYFYQQENKLTSALEKAVYYILTATYSSLGTHGWSLVAAWGDLNPVTGMRFGDISEIDENKGVKLLNPERLAHQLISADELSNIKNGKLLDD